MHLTPVNLPLAHDFLGKDCIRCSTVRYHGWTKTNAFVIQLSEKALLRKCHALLQMSGEWQGTDSKQACLIPLRTSVERFDVSMTSSTSTSRQCCTCGQKFGTTSHLQRHMLTHTGERAFVCYICGRLFSRKDSLQRHLRNHAQATVTTKSQTGTIDISNEY